MDKFNNAEKELMGGGYQTNKEYCMSHYLAFRYIQEERINFFEGLKHKVYSTENTYAKTVNSAIDMDKIMKEAIAREYIPSKSAVFLSGGMDSAILASYMPAGTKAYTFKCMAPGAIDETVLASEYAKRCRLDHEIIYITWDDFETLMPKLFKHDQTPFHSIEVLLLKALLTAKSQGIKVVYHGDEADMFFGGLHNSLSKDWKFDDFINFYTFTNPAAVLKHPVSVQEVYERYRVNEEHIDFIRFMDEVYTPESTTSYYHAFSLAGIKMAHPYADMKPLRPLDLKRIRNGDTKYLVRELFAMRYPDMEIPEKIPMPRATEQWLKDYIPTRDEFIPGCEQSLSGDQKWQLYCLESFLNFYDIGGFKDS